MERKSFVVFSILILLLAAQEVVVKTEARTCKKPSKFYKGPCFRGTYNSHIRNDQCARDEGLLSGFCKGYKCVCTYAC